MNKYKIMMIVSLPILAGVMFVKYQNYNECRDFGHSVLYCLYQR